MIVTVSFDLIILFQNGNLYQVDILSSTWNNNVWNLEVIMCVDTDQVV